jgi:hypothetical protein
MGVKLMKKKNLRWILYAVAAAAMVAIYRDTYYNGWDFSVYYNSMVAAWSGVDPYTPGTDVGWNFKYPPWTIPFFLPLGLLPLQGAKALWGILQILCIIYSFRWLRRQGVSAAVCWVTSACFWFLFAYHALAGQFSLMMLALALFGFSKKGFWQTFAAVWGLSAKMFTAFSLLGYSKLRPHLLKIAGAFAVLSLPALWLTPGHSLPRLLQSWLGSSNSSSAVMANDIVRGWRNQGLPAFFLKNGGVDRAHAWADLLAFILLAALAFYFWKPVSKKLSKPAAWAGWLALGAALHPLAWFHSFILAYPLAAFAVEEALPKKVALKQKIAAGLGVLFITVVTFPIALQLCVKAWGVVLCCYSLQLSVQKRRV